MRVLLVTPPMSNLHTPYPATAYLAGFLRVRGVEVRQADASLALARRLFSPTGLERLAGAVREAESARREAQRRSGSRWKRLARSLLSLSDARDRRAEHFLTELDRYRQTVEPVLRLLEGRDGALGPPLLSRGLLPEGGRLRRYFGGRPQRAERQLDQADQSLYVASLYLRELGDVVRDVDPGFHLNAYAESVARGPDFDAVLDFLAAQREGLIAAMIAEWTSEQLQRDPPDLLGLTVPFPGNLVGALRIAQLGRRLAPRMRIALGGGYVNCYLRGLSDPRLFDFIDFVTLDAGEAPLIRLLEHLESGERNTDRLLRTYVRRRERVVYCSDTAARDVPFVESATPVYAELPLERYLAVRFDTSDLERIAHRRWSSLTLAHGCYWRKCTFCDISLDYVRRYEPQRVDRLVEQIRAIVDETGCNAFHWVDEAAPPSLLRALCLRLLELGVEINWWGNVRFERAFTAELARLMRRAGCVMVTGGLEVASDRLLQRIRKGVTVAQVARVAKNIAEQGIHVHAYLMYGFPSESVQETVDSLELVRQMFVAGCLHSGHWHRFVATEHSPIGLDPERFGIRLLRPPTASADRVFARYGIPFEDPTGVDHDSLGGALVRALAHYQLGDGLDRPAHAWFGKAVPETAVAPDAIARALAGAAEAGSGVVVGTGSESAGERGAGG